MTAVARNDRYLIASIQRYSVVVMLVAVVVAFASISKPFFTASNLSNILLQSTATSMTTTE